MGINDMKSYGSALFMLIALCSLAVSGRAVISAPSDIPGLPSIPPDGHQPLRASVINNRLDRYTFDLRKFANIGVTDKAPSFAIYTSSGIPAKCGDFRATDLPYRMEGKYHRIYDLRGHDDIVRALDGYRCIVVGNADWRPETEPASPPAGPAD